MAAPHHQMHLEVLPGGAHLHHEGINLNFRGEMKAHNPNVHNNQHHNLERKPRVVVHLPEWLSQFTSLSRSLKMVLMAVATVGCIGSFLYISDLLPDTYGLVSTSTSISDRSQISAIKGIGISGSQYGAAPPHGIHLSPRLAHIVDSAGPLQRSDIPFFFHVPRSGGTTMMKIIGVCVGLVQASDVGGKTGLENEKLEVNMTDTGPFVNVNTYTVEGIDRAAEKGLAQSNLVGSIASPFPYKAASLFSSYQHGRTFTLLRHPAERANSFFHHIIKAVGEPNYEPLFGNINLEQYASMQEDRPEFNYVTKILAGKATATSSQLTTDDLNIAKEFLRKKVVIGLLSDRAESLRRFELYFDWSYPEDKNKFCGEELFNWEKANANEHPDILPGEPSWNLLLKRNSFDMDLYEYATNLFKEQGDTMFNLF